MSNDINLNNYINNYLQRNSKQYNEEDIINAINHIKNSHTYNNGESIFSFDNNNNLLYEDFVQQLNKDSQSNTESLEEEYNILYDILDFDGNGKISKDEMTILFDNDNNGTISLKEFNDNLVFEPLNISSTTPQKRENLKLDVNTSKGISLNGDFSNKQVATKRAEEVNPDLFEGPVVTLSKYEQERILSSGLINDFKGYSVTKAGNCFFRENADGTTDYIRVVNDNGNYKIIHTVTGEGINNTQVYGIDRKNISNFTMPQIFQGSGKNNVQYDNLGNYHISANQNTNTIEKIIKEIYGVNPSSEQGQKIYEAIKNKNSILGINNLSQTIEAGKDIILVDDKELLAIEEIKSGTNLFDSDVTITSQYVNNGSTMPYLLLGPENPDPNVEYPVIVFLHGLGQTGKGENSMYQVHTPGGFMQDLDLENFNGYVICPQLTGRYNCGNWDNSKAEGYLRDCINNFSQTHNIDSDKIALTGASAGGIGTIYMASHMDDVFCSAAAISGYPTSVQPKDIKIPIRGYVGQNDDRGSIYYMENVFAAQLGADSLTKVSADHAHAPKEAFGLDSNGDNCSDLIQWLFNDNNKPQSIKLSDFIQSEPVYPKKSVDRTPTSLNTNIQNVVWEDYGYDADTGRKFADSAVNVTERLRANNISTNGNCLGGVKNTFIDVTGESPFGAPGQGTTVAANCAQIMENLEGYREITGISVTDLKYLPAGAVVVWSKSTQGDDPASKYGHISISLGDGRESSAVVVNQYRTVGMNGKPRVFIPIG